LEYCFLLTLKDKYMLAVIYFVQKHVCHLLKYTKIFLNHPVSFDQNEFQ